MVESGKTGAFEVCVIDTESRSSVDVSEIVDSGALWSKSSHQRLDLS